MNALPRQAALVATLLALLATTRSSRATTYVNDPLTSASSPGLGVRGGTFSSAGWTTTSNSDTLWWTIPDALESATLQFTVTGMALGTTLTDADNDIFSFYQAPTGVSEPVAYSPYYRNNDMRVFIRVFGSSAGSPINGAMKIEGIQCLVGPPYYDHACPSSCTAYDGIAYANGRQTDVGWDGAHAYQFTITWNAGTMTYARDGTVLGTLTYPSPFAPQPLTVHIGCPRNGMVTGASMPVGLTFRDFSINGTAGTQTPVCTAPLPPPDAGPPVIAPCTDGSIGATQDVTATSFQSGVFNDPTDLNVEADAAGTPTAIVYMMFPPQPGPIARAVLRLHTQLDVHAEGGSGQPCLVSSSIWDESTLTWSSRPAVTVICAGGAHSVTPDSEVEWDVTSLIAGTSGNVSLALVSTDPNGAHYFSRESGGCARGPRLLVTPGTEPMDSGTPVDSGASLPDAADARDARDVAVDAGADTRVGGIVRASCGCRAAGAAHGHGGWLLAAAVAGISSRWRRRRSHDAGALPL